MLQESRFSPYRTQVNGVWLRYDRTEGEVQRHRAQLVCASSDQNVEGVVAMGRPRSRCPTRGEGAQSAPGDGAAPSAVPPERAGGRLPDVIRGSSTSTAIPAR